MGVYGGACAVTGVMCAVMVRWGCCIVRGHARGGDAARLVQPPVRVERARVDAAVGEAVGVCFRELVGRRRHQRHRLELLRQGLLRGALDHPTVNGLARGPQLHVTLACERVERLMRGGRAAAVGRCRRARATRRVGPVERLRRRRRRRRRRLDGARPPPLLRHPLASALLRRLLPLCVALLDRRASQIGLVLVPLHEDVQLLRMRYVAYEEHRRACARSSEAAEHYTAPWSAASG